MISSSIAPRRAVHRAAANATCTSRPRLLAPVCVSPASTSRFSSVAGVTESDEARSRKDAIDALLRVDHAGEIGANVIYKGQIAVLGRDKAVRPMLQHMLDQEVVHLAEFDSLLAEHRTRPSLLRPLWEATGFTLGAVTAAMGKEAAMACTEAVETVIGEHYNDQIRDLLERGDPKDAQLIATLKRFRDEELEHKDIAVENDSQQAPFYTALSTVIQQGCRAAIWVAKRV
ncbi:ubiquinone biosynthesis protein COQ7 [Gonapodya prolifera JEL478]|uniref:5-demethoxyubiquinone hydroxylase, mitochondrial n=1 Tax=Gonapodya prolifera (strain JEL478) TaxID=1344416 RepID=A0A138ZZ48_GONPJ|nr:ubiquinone biosynthesis protein COQ7 [Gonapodya prolifera JEL478]|eukprot:KXS09761.1 ubiquinone biosynthesis protein COQ7 [Gonapodya prolifera JEL478]